MFLTYTLTQNDEKVNEKGANGNHLYCCTADKTKTEKSGVHNGQSRHEQSINRCMEMVHNTWQSGKFMPEVMYQKPSTLNTITSVADLSSRSSVMMVRMLPSDRTVDAQNQG